MNMNIPDKGFLQFVRYADYLNLSLEQKWEVIQVEYNICKGINPPKECLFNYVDKCYGWYLDGLDGWHIVGEPFNYPDSCYPQ